LSEDTSKKLWLRVARHVVQEKNDIKQVNFQILLYRCGISVFLSYFCASSMCVINCASIYHH